jgi:hypothetical protein
VNEDVASGGEQGLFLHLYNHFVIFSKAFIEKPRYLSKNAEHYEARFIPCFRVYSLVLSNEKR